MCANSEKELHAKMQEWLDYVISEINKPLIECPHCKGLGIVEPNTDKILFDFEAETGTAETGTADTGTADTGTLVMARMAFSATNRIEILEYSISPAV